MPERPSLVDARRLVAAATKGPWSTGVGAHGNPADGPNYCEVTSSFSGQVAELDYSKSGSDDAEFIAASRDLAPALLEVVDAVEDFIAHMTALDRGRITGREVAGHLRRAITEHVNIEGENRG